MAGYRAAGISTKATFHPQRSVPGGTLARRLVFKPIFRGEALIAWAGTVCHHTDVGGRVPGSNASDSTEIYQEGLRIPPLKRYERGQSNETLFALIEKNVRVPVKVFGDLRAQLAACHIAEAAMLDLAAHYGVEKLAQYMTELVDYAERMTRAAIKEPIRRGLRFLDHIDDDGIDVGVPIPLKVTLTKTGDTIHADWTGTAKQVKGAINNTLSYTKSATYCGIRSILPQNILTNEGVFRAISVEAPEERSPTWCCLGACMRAGLLDSAWSIACSARWRRCCPIGCRGVRRRQYRRLDRWLGQRAQAFHLCRFYLLRLGRTAWRRRARRQFEHLRQHGLAADRSDRDRAAAADRRLRIHPGRDGPGQMAGRRAVPPGIPASGRRGDFAGALRPPRLPAVRALWRRPGPTVDELPKPRPGPGAAALQADDDDEKGRFVPARGRRRRRLGRPARP